jgi:hypothetical protein
MLIYPEWGEILDQLEQRYARIEYEAGCRQKLEFEKGTSNIPATVALFRQLRNCYESKPRIALWAVFAPRIAVSAGELLDALECISGWLRQTHGVYPPFSPENEQKELRELRWKLVAAVNRSMAALNLEKAPPYSGEDFEKQQPKVKALLTFMDGREEADIESVFFVVWKREYSCQQEAVDQVVKKASAFLSRQGSRRTLRRKGNRIYWE